MVDIHIEGLSKAFGNDTVLDSINLTIDSGQLICILGPSGCGKSTLLRSVAGLETPDSGSIRIGDRVVFDADRGINEPPERRRLGMVFQSYALWPHKSVHQNVAYPLQRQKVPRGEIGKRVEAALATVGLGGKAMSYPSNLSGGQQQRVALARAVVSDPALLLFDEPLSNLDANLRRQMRREIRQYQRSLGTTSLFVTHDREDSGALADRVVVLQSGRIVQEGRPSEVFSRPATPFVGEFGGFDGTLEGTADDSGAVLILDSGLKVELRETVAPQSRHRLGFRSRLLRVTDRRGSVPGMTTIFDGRVSSAADLGDEIDVVVANGQATINARISPRSVSRLDEGAEVSVAANVEDCVLFPHGSR